VQVQVVLKKIPGLKPLKGLCGIHRAKARCFYPALRAFFYPCGSPLLTLCFRLLTLCFRLLLPLCFRLLTLCFCLLTLCFCLLALCFAFLRRLYPKTRKPAGVSAGFFSLYPV